MIPCSYKADYAQYTVYNPMEDINKEYHSHREFLVAEMIVDEGVGNCKKEVTLFLILTVATPLLPP